MLEHNGQPCVVYVPVEAITDFYVTVRTAGDSVVLVDGTGPVTVVDRRLCVA